MEQPFWHIIVNPAANKGRVSRLWPAFEALLQELGFAYSAYFTKGRGDAMDIVDRVALQGGRYILGLGGDGTNHELVNGIMRQQHCPSTEIHYALMPMGTGNDWARTYDTPTNMRARLLRLQHPEFRHQDVGLAHFIRNGVPGERYFVNVAGMAYDGYIGQQLETRPVKNKLDYLLRVAQHLFEYKLSKARIHFDGRSAEDYFYTINIGLCRYSGGGMQFVPQAVPDDGLFALTYAGKLSKVDVLLQTPRFYNGSLLKHPKVEGHQAEDIVVEHLEGHKPTLLEADGEFLGETPVKFTLLKRALKLAI